MSAPILPVGPDSSFVDDGVRRSVRMIENIADRARKQNISAAWDAYLGTFPPSLKADPEEPDLNISTNRIAPIVDMSVFWLFGDVLNIEVDAQSACFGTYDVGTKTAGGDSTSGESAADVVTDDASAGAHAGADVNPQVASAQDYLDGCWGDDDDRMTLLSKDAMNAKLAGHGFFKIIPPDKAAGREFCRLVVLDPKSVDIVSDPEDCDTVVRYVITYESSADDGTTIQKRQVIAYVDADGNANPADRNDYWTITNYARGSTGGDWQPIDKDGPLKWPHPWPPIIDHPNFPMPNQRWGLPEVTPGLIQSNKALNFVESSINALGYYHGHPWMFATNTNVERIKVAPGSITGLAGKDAHVVAVSASGDVPGLMSFAAEIRANMDEQSHTPSVATGRIADLPRGQQSGVMIRMLYTPRDFKTRFEQRVYGKAIREASARMLALGGFGDGTDLGGVNTLLHWGDPMPVDSLEEAQAAQAWQAVGVSADTLMQRGGFDPEAEADKKRAEDANKATAYAQGQGMPPMPPMMMGADAAQNAPEGQQGAQSGDGGNVPPVNHPAAVRQRALVSAASQAANATPRARSRASKTTAAASS